MKSEILEKDSSPEQNLFSNEESPETDESKDSIDFNEKFTFFNENQVKDSDKEQKLIFNIENKKPKKDVIEKKENKISSTINVNNNYNGMNILNINKNNNNSILLNNENSYSPLFNIEYKEFLNKNEKINNNTFPNNNMKNNIIQNVYNYNQNNSFFQTQNSITNISNININNINIKKFNPTFSQNNYNIKLDFSQNFNNNNNNNNKKGKKNNPSKNYNNKKKLNTFNNEIINIKIFIENLNTPLDNFICSQTGSRMLQNNLDNFSKQIIDILIDKIKSSFEKLMSDVYGNYFCQKLYNMSNFEQRLLILESIKDSFISISKTKSGSHVAQSIIEQALTPEEKKKIMSFMLNYEIEMALDTEGTHVLQKIIQIFPEIERQSLTDVLCKSENVNILCKDLKGISVIKRLISFNKEEKNRIKLVDALYDNCLNIIKTSSGSYILQFLLEEWGLDTGIKLVYFSIYNFETFARYKHGANFINKIIILSLKKCSINRFFVNGSNLVFVKTAIIIINALKNIILDYNKIINVYKYKYGKTLIYNIRKLFSNSENEKFYLYIQSLGPLTKDFDTKKYQIYSEIYKSNNSITL